MAQLYTDPSRTNEPHALPNAEVFHVSNSTVGIYGDLDMECGWYWWPCFPGCLPDGEPVGPFDTEAEATCDAQA